MRIRIKRVDVLSAMWAYELEGYDVPAWLTVMLAHYNVENLNDNDAIVWESVEVERS